MKKEKPRLTALAKVLIAAALLVAAILVYYAEIIDFVEYLKMKHLKTLPETMILSESALAKDWNTPEEDKAWADL
jgi:hypothetical protein